jgi:hypothetical protein
MGALAFGCGGQAITSGPGSGDSAQGTAATPVPGMVTPEKVTTPGTLATYGAAGVGIALYPPDLSASTQPLVLLDGSWQTNACEALSFDSGGDLYALCYQAGPSEPPDQVVVFAADAQGSDAPKRVITGPSTTLGGYATNLAVGATGKIYVVQDAYCEVENCAGMVSVFAPGADGNSAPVQVIQGPHTGLNYSAAIAVDAAGLIYVGNAEGGPILVFSADATGDIQPIRRIGRASDIGDAIDIALDASGTIYVADATIAKGVLVYGPAAADGAPPDRVIAGPMTGLSEPMAVAVDSTGRVLVSERHGLQQPGTVSIFANDADGNVAPETVLSNVAGMGIAIAP